MQINVSQKEFLKALQTLIRFTPSKPAIPILANILLKTGEEHIELCATNMETAIKLQVSAKVVTKGEISVPAKLLNEFTNLLSKGDIDINLANQSLLLVSGSHKASLPVSPADEFPQLPEIITSDTFSLAYADMEKAVKHVNFSAALDDSRPVLAELLLEFDPVQSQVRIVATDGYRLSLLDHVDFSGKISPKTLLFSAKLFAEITKQMKDLQIEECSIGFSEEQKSLVITLGEATQIISRITEGDFPSYQRILPTEEQSIFAIARDELLEAVKIASVFARESANIVKWYFDDGRLIVSANSSNGGGGETTLDIREIQEGSGAIAFNGKFLTDFLSSTDTKEIIFVMNGSLQPGLFKVEGEEYLHVIMPVRTQETS